MATKAPPTKTAPVKKSAPTKAPPAKAAPTKSAPSKKLDGKSVDSAAPATAEKYTIKNLQDDVASKLGLVGRATVDRVVVATFEAVSAAFLSGKAVNIKDFGKIEIKNRPERVGRNPKTGENITIPAKVVPKFTFAKVLKDGAQ